MFTTRTPGDITLPPVSGFFFAVLLAGFFTVFLPLAPDATAFAFFSAFLAGVF
jgi:hypothetical protein